MHYRTISLFLVFLLFLGCHSEQNSHSSETAADTTNPVLALPDFSTIKTADVFVYQCADSVQFTAHVTMDSTWIFLPDTAAKLQHVQAASGAKYQSPGYLYWSKGAEALFQAPTGSLMDCRAVPKEKSWQAAKIRGVDFRAVGQEPGWELEIINNKQMQYIGSYGRDTLSTPAPQLKQGASNTHKVYEAQSKKHTLKVDITDQSCTDSMNGFQFPSTVMVTVDGKSYQGCGKRLD